MNQPMKGTAWAFGLTIAISHGVMLENPHTEWLFALPSEPTSKVHTHTETTHNSLEFVLSEVVAGITSGIGTGTLYQPFPEGINLIRVVQPSSE